MKRVHKKLTTLCISLSLCAASLAGCGASTQLSSPETQASAQTEAVTQPNCGINMVQLTRTLQQINSKRLEASRVYFLLHF